MHIIIDRDAVCAADDMSHHREEFTVPDGITIASLFEFLEFKYIPVIGEITWSGRFITTTLRWALILLKIVAS